MSKFIFRKQYVPGFFMINYNKTYAHSFNIRVMYSAVTLYLMAMSMSLWTATTQPAKSCGDESF